MLKSFIDHRGWVVLDGGVATELERQGCDLSGELWSAKIIAKDPEAIRKVHASYFEAGADVALTCTYQASFSGFAKQGFSPSRAREMFFTATALAKEARDAFWAANSDPSRARPIVVGSIGCYGAILADGSEYRGKYGVSEEKILEMHESRWQVLASAGVDMMAIETVPDAGELSAVSKLLRRHPDMPCWVSIACKDGKTLNSGHSIAKALEPLVPLSTARGGSLEAVGVNCSAPSIIGDCLGELTRVLPEGALKVVYPNSGEKWNAVTREWETDTGMTAGDFAACVPLWRDAKAVGFGGCCRTTPETIRAVRAKLDSLCPYEAAVE